MKLHNINPTQTKAWQKLKRHYIHTKDIHLRTLFLEFPNREKELTINWNSFNVDLSKNRIQRETLSIFEELAKECYLKEAIDAYFSGEKINQTEGRAVLHTALRDLENNNPLFIDGKDIRLGITETLSRIEEFSKRVISGEWKGYSGKPIDTVVNIGIGGSHIGPSMVIKALSFYKNHLTTYFISNIDGDHVFETLNKLNPQTTLFVIVSKTFKTQETLSNVITTQKWFLETAPKEAILKHFVAVSNNVKAAINFGLSESNIFSMCNWVSGRFSLWGSVGLIISLALGYDVFKELLQGAHKMDEHFKVSDFNRNIPVLLAFITIWYNNFYQAETEAILPYSKYLSKLPKYLQQIIMESNGKGIDRNGNPVSYQTGNIIFGGTGTNMQHAFMQLIHQGTKLIPCEFIGFKESLNGLKEHHDQLMSNYYAQMQALVFGKREEELEGQNYLTPFKVFKGNHPCTSILIEKLTPFNLGALLSLYEHKIFTQGVIWNIFSYDQFGVELGKELAKKFFN